MGKLNWDRSNSNQRMATYGSEQAAPKDKSAKHHWRTPKRRPPKPRSPYEVRAWSLECKDCGHYGTIEISLHDLRVAVAAGRVHCQACGVVRIPITSA